MTDSISTPVERARPSARRRLLKMEVRSIYAMIALLLLLVVIVVAIEMIRLTTGHILDGMVQLGFLQPLSAAAIAFVIVLGTWMANGRFANEQRKGVKSASSATIAVQLWALCFTLLVSAMLAASFLAGAQRGSTAIETTKPSPKPMGGKSTAASSTSVRVAP